MTCCLDTAKVLTTPPLKYLAMGLYSDLLFPMLIEPELFRQ